MKDPNPKDDKPDTKHKKEIDNEDKKIETTADSKSEPKKKTPATTKATAKKVQQDKKSSD